MSKRILSVFVLVIMLCMLSISAFAEWGKLGYYSIRKSLDNPNSPFLANEVVVKDATHSPDVYNFYFASGESTKSEVHEENAGTDWASLAGNFTIMLIPCDNNGKLINTRQGAIIQYFVGAKGTYGYSPKIHALVNMTPDGSLKPSNMTDCVKNQVGGQPLYQNSAASDMAYIISGKRMRGAMPNPNQ